MIKKFLFGCILSSCFAFAANAGTYTIVKQGGGPEGYDKVDEQTEGGNTTMKCTDPGCDDCKVTASSIRIGEHEYNVNDIMSYIGGIVSSDNQGGSYNLEDAYTVSWSGTDSYNVEVTISPISE